MAAGTCCGEIGTIFSAIFEVSMFTISDKADRDYQGQTLSLISQGA